MDLVGDDLVEALKNKDKDSHRPKGAIASLSIFCVLFFIVGLYLVLKYAQDMKKSMSGPKIPT